MCLCPNFSVLLPEMENYYAGDEASNLTRHDCRETNEASTSFGSSSHHQRLGKLVQCHGCLPLPVHQHPRRRPSLSLKMALPSLDASCIFSLYTQILDLHVLHDSIMVGHPSSVGGLRASLSQPSTVLFSMSHATESLFVTISMVVPAACHLVLVFSS